jgi:hypothetical protein
VLRLKTRRDDHRPAASLPDFIARVNAQIRAVEKGEKKRKGGPGVARYASALRRDGRWFFLVETNRTTEKAIIEKYHESRGEKHAYEQGVGLCESCRVTVPARIKNAHKILLLAE